MISVIICSVNPFLLENVKENISLHIGVPFEILAIDNTKTGWGICEAYNSAASRARFPFLCFMHEDIIINTTRWGEKVIHHLSDPKTGLIGVAGGDSKSRVPSSWSSSIVSNEINIIQHFKSPDTEPKRIWQSRGGGKEIRQQVACLDGVWMCTRKEIFDHFRFDQVTFPGFHGYDIDFSLQIGTRYRNYVIFDIELHHYSPGNQDRKWLKSAIDLSKKWKRYLPVSVFELSREDRVRHHWANLRIFLDHLFRLDYSLIQILGHYLKYAIYPHFRPRQFLSLSKHIVIEKFRRKYMGKAGGFAVSVNRIGRGQ